MEWRTASRDKHWQDDQDVVMAAVKLDGLALKFASKTVKDTKVVVMAAVKQNPRGLQYASDYLRMKDNDVLAVAMRAA